MKHNKSKDALSSGLYGYLGQFSAQAQKIKKFRFEKTSYIFLKKVFLTLQDNGTFWP